MTLGQRLQQLRELAGLNQSELARRSGVRRPLISMLENGKQTGMTLDTARKLARALGVTIDMLAGPETDEDPASAELAAVS